MLLKFCDKYFSFFLLLVWQTAQCDKVQVNFSVLAPNLFPAPLMMIFLHLPLCTAQIMPCKAFYVDQDVIFLTAFIVRKSPTEAGGDVRVIADVLSNGYIL